MCLAPAWQHPSLALSYRYMKSYEESQQYKEGFNTLEMALIFEGSPL
jgi:hypothetical protein